MKSLLFLLALTLATQAAQLIPSKEDPALADAREKAFIPWSDQQQSSDYWKKLASHNIPVCYERKDGTLSRDLYIPNPGTGYWVLGGLTEEELFRTHAQKLKIGDTLIGATIYQDEKGQTRYWALWAPKSRAHLITDQMKTYGVTQAEITYTPLEKFQMWAGTPPEWQTVLAVSIGLNILLFLVVVILAIATLIKRTTLRSLEISST